MALHTLLNHLQIILCSTYEPLPLCHGMLLDPIFWEPHPIHSNGSDFKTEVKGHIMLEGQGSAKLYPFTDRVRSNCGARSMENMQSFK